jgi:hypothetical protein
MANRSSVMNKLRPRIINQGTVDLETLTGRAARNTTFNAEELYAMMRLCLREAREALQAGETVKFDGLLSVRPNMKVGGAVDLGVRGDRGAVSALNNPRLWTADKVANHRHKNKDYEQLIAQWNAEHPDDPVEE